MSIFSYKQRNNINLVIIIALGCLIAYSLMGIFGSLLSTLVLYTILRPGYIYLTEVKNWNRRLAALLLLFISIVVLILPFYTLSSMVIEKINELRNDHIYFTNLKNKFDHLYSFPPNVEAMIDDGVKK